MQAWLQIFDGLHTLRIYYIHMLDVIEVAKNFWLKGQHRFRTFHYLCKAIKVDKIIDVIFSPQIRLESKP